jgi:hypothetical protein
MVTDHTLWELQDGTSSLFLSDSWQQLSTLDKDPTMIIYKPLTEVARLLKVVDYWNNEENRATWCRWKSTHVKLNIPPKVNLQLFLEKINSRNIFIQ